MEGKIGNVFETQFRYAVRNNSYSSMPSNNTVSESNQSVKPSITTEVKEKSVNHILRNSGIAAGIGVVLLAPVVMLASKGKFPKLSNYLTKRLNNISKKIEELREKPQMSKAEMAYLNSLQKSNKTLNSIKGVLLNTGPLKDVLFEKTLRKIGLGKLCNKVTGFFEKMAVKMTSIAYKKSNNAFIQMKDNFAQTNKNLLSSSDKSKVVTINGVSKTVGDWLGVAGEKLNEIDTAYDSFRPKAVSKRYKWLSKQFNGLGDIVFDKTYGNLKKFLTTPKSWTSFITEDLAAPTKIKFVRNVSNKKKVITNTRTDTAKDIDKLVSNIEASVDMTHKGSVDLLKRLKKAVSDFTSKDNPQPKDNVLEQINGIIQDSMSVLNDSDAKYSSITSKKIRKSLGNIRYVIGTDKKGKVEELLEIYKHLLSPEDYEVLKKSVQKSRTAFNNAVDTESDKFVDKMRDLKSGSALSDVGIGLLFPLGSTAVAMSMADTKEKKRSVALNLGVPLLVGLATSMVGTVAMLAAGPAMALGLVTSTITNQICSRIDDRLKKRDAEKLLAQQNSGSTTI